MRLPLKWKLFRKVDKCGIAYYRVRVSPSMYFSHSHSHLLFWKHFPGHKPSSFMRLCDLVYFHGDRCFPCMWGWFVTKLYPTVWWIYYLEDLTNTKHQSQSLFLNFSWIHFDFKRQGTYDYLKKQLLFAKEEKKSQPEKQLLSK